MVRINIKMKYLLSIVAVGLLVAPLHAQAKVNIFACEPEWAALADEIGGEKVKTFSATHAKQDPHHIRARPSLMAKVRQADMIFCSGAELEVGWLPLLLHKAGAAVQHGNVGHLMATDFVPLLEKSTVTDRSMGDVHPEGNPHIHLNPHHLLLVANELSKRLIQLDGENEGFYRQQWQNFSTRWQHSIDKWEKMMADVKGAHVIVHHKSFTYLLDWLGLQQVGSLEPKPGIPPTLSHLEKILQQVKTTPARVIIRTAYDSRDASQWLAKKTNMQAIMLPYTVGGDDEAVDLFTLFDRTLMLLKEALHD